MRHMSCDISMFSLLDNCRLVAEPEICGIFLAAATVASGIVTKDTEAPMRPREHLASY